MLNLLRLAAQLDSEGKFKGSVDIGKHLLKTRGVSGLFTGWAGMQIRQMLWTGGFFMSLDWYKEQCAGVMGKGLATDVLYRKFDY